MRIDSISPSLQPIHDVFIKNSGVNLVVLRIDLMHPTIGGNKLFKLKYNLEEAKKQNLKTLLTFGGAFSNHIAATAAAGKEVGLKTIGIIRGEEHQELNPTLRFAVDNGMQLKFISREHYRNKNSNEFIDSLNQQFKNFYLIPEGGSNDLGVKGCKEIIQTVGIDFDHVCCACGTGATMAGITLSLKKGQEAIGFQVLKAEGYIQQEVTKWLQQFDRSASSPGWDIKEGYHFGGYAKISPELINFIDRFEKNNGIPLDNIYTGKMMFGIYDLVQKGVIKKGKTVVAIHTGGLQGNVGFGK